MEGKELAFDVERCNLGINLVCDAFDSAGLNMAERFRASHILAVSSARMLGFTPDELAEKLGILDES